MKRNLEKTCERCGCGFTCGLYGCWCGNVAVSDSQYAVITERFADCLCASCLKALVHETPDSPPADGTVLNP